MTAPVQATARPPRRKLDREETERRLIAAFDRVWSRDGIQGLGINAVLKEAGLGKALLYRCFGDFFGLARAWAEGETILPKPPVLAGVAELDGRLPQVAVAVAYARALPVLVPVPAARAAAGKVSASAPGARPPRRQP